jgi:hypothetical protein
MFIREYIVGDKIIFRKWTLWQDLRDIKGVIYEICYHKSEYNFYKVTYIGACNIRKVCNLFPIDGSLYELVGDESMMLDIQAIREDEINKILN